MIDAKALIERIYRNTKPEHDNAQACQLWTRRKRSKEGYGRLNVYMGEGIRWQISAHVLLFACFAAQEHEIEWWEALLTLRASGLEVDHICEQPPCCNIDHLQLLTPSENCLLRGRRRR